MQKNEINQRVIMSLQKTFDDIPHDKFTPQATLRNDLRADSLDAIEAIMAIEEEFDIEINDDSFWLLGTVDDVCKHVASLVEARS